MVNRPEPIRQTSLLMILAAGVGSDRVLIDALSAHANETGAPWGDRVQSLRLLIEQGMPLSTALSNNPGLLPDSTVAAIRVAEKNGVLKEVLADEALRLSQRDDGADSSGGGMLNTLVWLMSVGVAAVFVVGFVMVYIVPKMKRIFEDFGRDLPNSTVLLIESSETVFRFWYLFLFAAMTLFVVGGVLLVWARFLYVARGRVLGAEFFPRFWTPILLRSASASMMGGRDLVATVHAVQCEMRPGRASYHLSMVRSLISAGTPFVEALRKCRLITARESNFLSAAETSSHLDWGLLHLCRTIENRRARLMARLTRFFQLMATLTLGFVVMIIVVAMFMPLIQLITDLSVEPKL